MIELAKIEKFRISRDGTEMVVLVPKRDLADLFLDKHIKTAEIRFYDGRTITAEQRKKAYATMADISDWTGENAEVMKHCLKNEYVSRTGNPYFSLSDCSIDTAREFISTIIDIAIEYGVQLKEPAVNRAEDVDRFLYSCIKNKRCAVCGRDGEIHHVDTIGMGNDRRKVDDSKYRKICLCRKHHTEIHTIGTTRFEEKYHVYGIEVEI